MVLLTHMSVSALTILHLTKKGPVAYQRKTEEIYPHTKPTSNTFLLFFQSVKKKKQLLWYKNTHDMYRSETEQEYELQSFWC